MALTFKQKLFCEEYVAAGYKDQIKCYMRAFPDASPETANAKSWALLKREDILGYIRSLQKERFDALNVSAERIALKLSQMAFADKDDEVYTPAVQQKALELLQKQLGLQTQRVDAKVEVNNITVDIEEE